MTTLLLICQLLISVSLSLAKEADLQLPPCPRHLQFMPQDLPMHCRMPRNADNENFGMPDMSQFQTLPPDFPFFQSPSPDKQPPPIPIPFPGMPGMPPGMGSGMPPGMQQGMPPGMQQGMPPDMQLPMPPGMRLMPGMSGPMPMPMPMPIPMPAGPAHKLPVIVMPFYSPDRRSYQKPPHRQKHPRKHPHKNKSNRHNSSEAEKDSDASKNSSDESDSDGSDDAGWWKGKGHKKKKGHKKYGIYRRFNRHHNIKKKKKGDLLTPILQYVTKDGYVIFEKKISKSEASDWLGPKEEAKVKEEEAAAKNDLEILDEQVPKVEAEDAAMEETPKSNVKESGSMEVNEMNELAQTEKPHKKQRKKKNDFMTPS